MELEASLPSLLRPALGSSSSSLVDTGNWGSKMPPRLHGGVSTRAGPLQHLSKAQFVPSPQTDPELESP